MSQSRFFSQKQQRQLNDYILDAAIHPNLKAEPQKKPEFDELSAEAQAKVQDYLKGAGLEVDTPKFSK